MNVPGPPPISDPPPISRQPPRHGALIAWTRALGIATAVIVVDQITKHAVRASIPPGAQRGFLPGIELVDTRNTGIAFGLFQSHEGPVTAVIAVAIAAIVIYFARHLDKPLLWLATGLLVGGAAGNVYDRLRYGWVTDFVKLPLGWPPFNLADASITIGMVTLVIVAEINSSPRRDRSERSSTRARASRACSRVDCR